MIEEAGLTFDVESADVPNKEMTHFYNPVMRVNRDLSLLALEAKQYPETKAVFPLAATGVRPLRVVNECTEWSHLYVNDIKPSFQDVFRVAAEQNDVSLDNVTLSSEDARSLPFTLPSYDFIEIDPYGSPNQFLDSAVQKLRHLGILAVTATDTAPLCGTYISTCRRKYWARPRRNDMMKEIGARILVRKAQLVGAQHEKALHPLFTVAKDHYLKVVFQCTGSKKDANNILKQHETREHEGITVGPLWTGSLQNQDYLKKMQGCSHITVSDETASFLDGLVSESKVDVYGFYDIHGEMKQAGGGSPPKTAAVLESLRENGFLAEKTHFAETGVKTDAPRDVFHGVLT